MEQIQQLAMPLNQSQIEAASEFWSSGWESREFALLKDAFPDPQDAVSIKAIVVNVLYGTNIIAIAKVAKCVERVLETTQQTGSNLVEQLVSEIRSVTQRNEYSFASKYAHFFIDSSTPILDSYAEWMLAQHLGIMQSKKPHQYEKFVEDIETLKQVAGLSCTCAELDSYLWVAGEYWWWIAHPHEKINNDLLPFFDNFLKNPERNSALGRLLGENAWIDIHDESQKIHWSHPTGTSE